MLEKLPLPPFGKILQAYQEESVKLAVPIYIYVGKNSKEECIAQKKYGTLCCFLPFGESHLNYRWPVFNQKLVIEDTGNIPARELKRMAADILQKYQPRVIFLYSISHKSHLFLPEGALYNE